MAWAKGSFQGGGAAAASPLHKPRAVQDGARGAGSGPGHAGVDVSEPGDELLWVPRGVGALRLDDTLRQLAGRGVGVVMRRPAPVEQAVFAVGLIAMDQLVARLAADPRLSAQFRDRLLPRGHALDKAQPLRFDARLFPRQHSFLLWDCLPPSHTVLPMCPV